MEKKHNNCNSEQYQSIIVLERKYLLTFRMFIIYVFRGATTWQNYEVIVNTYKKNNMWTNHTNLYKSIKLYLLDLFLFVGFLAVGDKQNLFSQMRNLNIYSLVDGGCPGV